MTFNKVTHNQVRFLKKLDVEKMQTNDRIPLRWQSIRIILIKTKFSIQNCSSPVSWRTEPIIYLCSVSKIRTIIALTAKITPITFVLKSLHLYIQTYISATHIYPSFSFAVIGKDEGNFNRLDTINNIRTRNCNTPLYRNT